MTFLEDSALFVKGGIRCCILMNKISNDANGLQKQLCDLAMQYAPSKYCSTKCSGVGAGITAGERVGIKK